MTDKKIGLALVAPFLPQDIEWRIQQAGLRKGNGGVTGWGLVLAYVTNRAIMERLDQVMGVDGWRNEYKESPGGGILCGLSLRFGDEWITKWDGADKTDIEATKGGLSNAMKRAAVQWGIGRYLYNLDSSFVNLYGEENERTHRYWDKATSTRHYWSPPKLPNWALPTDMEERGDDSGKFENVLDDDEPTDDSQELDDLPPDPVSDME